MERRTKAFILSIGLLLGLSLLLPSCGVVHHYKPIKEETIIHVIDSIAWHDSTVISYLTKERYVDVVNDYDTLNLETSYAKATAYVDTTHRTLKGTIENKPDVPVKTQIKWKEKIVYKDSIRIVEKEVPVEVIKEVKVYPKTYWLFMAISIAALAYIILKVYLKFKKI